MGSVVNIKDNRTLVTGIGSALIDILLQESDEFLAATKGQKGGMVLVEKEDIDGILATSKKTPAIVPGGSACNTIIGVGKLGGPARFIGKRGTDELGENFESALEKGGVEPVLMTTDADSGRVLSVITPDAQRSMFTFLGASAQMRKDEIVVPKFHGSAIVHIEGYLLFNEELMMAALKSAKESGALISLDLASFTVIEASKNILTSIIDEYIDIVIANEDEAAAYTGKTDEREALDALAGQAEVAVVKVGKRGSFIKHRDTVTHIGLIGKDGAVDTTGAGDLWAAGFLYGLAHGYSIEQSGTIGSACGGEVCQVVGAHIPEDGWDRIRAYL